MSSSIDYKDSVCIDRPFYEHSHLHHSASVDIDENSDEPEFNIIVEFELHSHSNPREIITHTYATLQSNEKLIVEIKTDDLKKDYRNINSFLKHPIMLYPTLNERRKQKDRDIQLKYERDYKERMMETDTDELCCIVDEDDDDDEL